MNQIRQINKWMIIALTALTLFIVKPVMAEEVGLMSKDELKLSLGTSEVIILDVRAGRDWSASEYKIKGAVREDPSNFENWSSTYPKDKKLVLYCA